MRTPGGHRFVGATGVPGWAGEISFADRTVIVASSQDEGRRWVRATGYELSTLRSREAPWTLVDDRWSSNDTPVVAMDDHVVAAFIDDSIEIHDRRRPPGGSRVARIETVDRRAIGVLDRNIIGVSEYGLSHFDARDPHHPVLVERRPEWAGVAIAVGEDVVFVGSKENGTTTAFSIDGGRLQERSTISAFAHGTSTSGNLLYISRWLYDVSDLDHIEQRARIGHGGSRIVDTALSGNLLHIGVLELDGIRVVDVSDPYQPRDLDTLRVNPLSSYDLSVIQDRLFVISGSETIVAYPGAGISRPPLAELEDPTGFGFDESEAMGELLVTSSWSWSADSTALQIWSAELERLSLLTLPGRSDTHHPSLDAAGTWIAVELDGLIHVVDAADPGAPAVVCVAEVSPAGSWRYELALHDGLPHLFAADPGGVHVYDCSDSGGPYHRGSYQNGGDLRVAAARDGRVVVFDHEDVGQVVHLLDWSDLASPTPTDMLWMRDLYGAITCTLPLENQLLMLDEHSLLESHAIEKGRFGKRVQMPVAGGMRFDLTADVLRVFYPYGVAEYVVNPGGAPPFSCVGREASSE